MFIHVCMNKEDLELKYHSFTLIAEEEEEVKPSNDNIIMRDVDPSTTMLLTKHDG